jgi:penicillin-binding protein 2
VPGLSVSGKTGTAQVVGLPGRGERRGSAAREFKDHAWFVCYAPSGAGQVAIAAIIEHGGHGGSASAPIARRLLAELKSLGYFQDTVARAGNLSGSAGEESP